MTCFAMSKASTDVGDAKSLDEGLGIRCFAPGHAATYGQKVATVVARLTLRGPQQPALKLVLEGIHQERGALGPDARAWP